MTCRLVARAFIALYPDRWNVVGVDDTNDPVPIDCIAVGHYLRVRPTGAERDLDVAISAALRPATSEEGTVLNLFHQRGVLRGDLGVPFFLPDPRKGHDNMLIAVAGMGQRENLVSLS